MLCNRRTTVLALVGLGGGVAADCQGNATCQVQLEDESLMQLGRLGLQAGLPGARVGKKGFAQHSKPFLAHAKYWSQEQQGRLLINEDGVENTYYLPGATTLDGGKTVKYLPPFRFYLMKTATTDYSNRDNFYMPILPGKTFSVDIDFKRDGPGCGCNLNFYLVGMPWHTAGQDNDYYCDAQCFPGLGCCYEFDMNEGNKDVQQITNHACTQDYPKHPDWQCNKWGDPELKTHPSDFAPGAGHTIDSNRLFTYSQRFDVNGDEFTFTTTMSQDDKSLVLRMGPGNSELNAMLGELQKGMAFVTGYWYDESMNWMDGELCGEGPEECNRHPAYISNWRITSNGPSPGPSPPSPPAPSPPAPSPPAPTPAPAPACEGCSVTVEVQPDNDPSETRWEIKDGSGEVVHEASSFATGTTSSEVVCLNGGDTYSFTIHDSYGDGMCTPKKSCGHYKISSPSGEEVASGGTFKSEETKALETANFCTVQPAPTPAPSPASGGKCCWGEEGDSCSNCKGPEDWCGESAGNCWACEGAWCKA